MDDPAAILGALSQFATFMDPSWEDAGPTRCGKSGAIEHPLLSLVILFVHGPNAAGYPTSSPIAGWGGVTFVERRAKKQRPGTLSQVG